MFEKLQINIDGILKENHQEHKTESFLYKITTDRVTSYLYGSTHFRFPGMGDLSQVAKSAFEKSTCLVLEQYLPHQSALSLEQDKINDAFFEWFENNFKEMVDYPDNFINSNKEHSENSDEEIDRFVDLFRSWEFPPIFQYHSLHTSILNKVLQKRGICADPPTLKFEESLKIKAEEFQIPCFGLENCSDAAIAFAGLTLNYTEQLEVVRHLLPQLDENNMDNFVMMMTKARLTHDLTEANKVAFGRLPINPSSTSSIDRYTQGYAYTRDKIMATNMRKHIDNGGAFITIGAVHLKGVIKELLALGGYKIEPIPEGPLVHQITSCSKIDKIAAHSLKNRSLFARNFSHNGLVFAEEKRQWLCNRGSREIE